MLDILELDWLNWMKAIRNYSKIISIWNRGKVSLMVLYTIEASRFHDVKIVNYWQSFYDEVLLSFLYKRKIAKDEDH